MSEIDPKLSRLYRESSSEVPLAAVDAAILAAARTQAAAPRRHPARVSWTRWMAPASALATLAVAVSLAYLMERERPLTSDDTMLRQAVPQAPSAPPARVGESIESKAKAADSAAPAPAAPVQTPAAKLSQPADAATMPAQAPATTAPAPLPAAPPSSAEAFPTERRAKPTASTMERETNVARDAAAGRLEAGAPAAPAAARPAPLRQQAQPRTPEAWLEDIARLQREGRDQEAAEQLAEFRKAYPAHAVPEYLLR